MFEYADMKQSEPKKKTWSKPEVIMLNIKKDTFGGSGNGAEDGGNKTIPRKW